MRNKTTAIIVNNINSARLLVNETINFSENIIIYMSQY